MLKFENVAEIGDTIKAFDFEPMEGRDDVFTIGKVVAKGMVYRSFDGVEYPMYKAYTIKVTASDKWSKRRKGELIYVPFESSMDYDGRVTLFKKAGPSDDELAAIGLSIMGAA